MNRRMMRGACHLILSIVALGMAACVTETVSAPRKPHSPFVLKPEATAPQTEEQQVVSLVAGKALGGLRDLDEAALGESGWLTGLEEARRINSNPRRFMNRGLYYQLIGRQYRIRAVETSDRAAQGGTAPEGGAAGGDSATSATQAGKAAGREAAPPPYRGEKFYILVAVPALEMNIPLAATVPYLFVVKQVNGKLLVVNADFIPADYMAGRDEREILDNLVADVIATPEVMRPGSGGGAAGGEGQRAPEGSAPAPGKS